MDFGTMHGAEARSRSPRYKAYKRVRDAEAFARRLGIGVVDYGGNVAIANLANHAFFLAWQRQAPLPQAVRVRPFTEEEDDPNEIAYYQPGFGNAPGEIEINTGHHLWDDPAGVMRLAREEHDFSTDDPRHAVAHELGELAMHQSVGSDRFDPNNEDYAVAEEAFRQEDLEHVFALVSDRATSNHSEFVAEVFAALLLNGDRLRRDAEIMRLFERYGGAEIRRYAGGS